MTIIEFKNVSLLKEGKLLLENISFSIQEGENWIIFGRNGSGKTLLLQLIEGYLFPSTGEIQRFGEKCGESDIREVRKKTGFLSTSIKSIMHENEVVFEAVISGKYGTIGIYDPYTDADKKKALELLSLTDSLFLKDRSFSSLSDGEKERVLISRALMSNPKCLILDEPCSNLDIKGREDFLQMLKQIKKFTPEIPILFVTHHADEISPLFTHILILKNGKIFRQGKIQETLTSPVVSEAFNIPVKVFQENGRYGCLITGL